MNGETRRRLVDVGDGSKRKKQQLLAGRILLESPTKEKALCRGGL